MVKLRLFKMGRKKLPYYRIVAIDSRVKRDGKYLELIGHYDPIKNDIFVNEELAIKWLNYGAQPSIIVKNILHKKNIQKSLLKPTK